PVFETREKFQKRMIEKRKTPFLGDLRAKSRLRRLRYETLCGAVFRSYLPSRFPGFQGLLTA
ncbi:MAG: hypothetical protein RRY97_07940, partial [Oscillibacter sp.]